jgi:hypothetical protein
MLLMHAAVSSVHYLTQESPMFLTNTLNIKKVLQLAGLAFVASALLTTKVSAAPEISIDGLQAGRINMGGGMLVISGVVSDPQGVDHVEAMLQTANRKKFMTARGSFQTLENLLPIQFERNTRRTAWSTLSYDIPPGNYLFTVRAKNNRSTFSKTHQVPVTVSAAVAAAPAQKNTAAPTVVIRNPADGSVVQGKPLISGFAEDDGSVVQIVATIMNADNGLYLMPNGQFGQRTALNVQSRGGKKANWSMPPMRLPPGNYLVAVRATDNHGKFGAWSNVRFTVPGAPAATQAQTAAASTGAAASAATVAQGKAANGMSFCSDQGKDVDGDGFGWENNQSCVVAGSRADTHPNCASSNSDPDGDGYGWENERSCIVVTHCAAADSDPDGDGFGWENERSCIVLKSTGRYPGCASPASDPDGDGYGWENNKTCIVQ